MHHDLAVLKRTVADEFVEIGDHKKVETFIGLVESRQALLEAQAFELGRKLLAQKKAALQQRWGACGALGMPRPFREATTGGSHEPNEFPLLPLSLLSQRGNEAASNQTRKRPGGFFGRDPPLRRGQGVRGECHGHV